MEPSGIERKLTVILAADVEGFTRLMRADEEATLKTLNTYRKIIVNLIDRHRGRVFGTAGDSVLAEFGSAVEAVRCAISVQEELRVRNAEIRDDRQLRFRIGINVGDVMVEGDNLFGDGVNVAARLEGVADPGGICISGDAYNQVRHKLSVSFDDIGPQDVKNIAEPVPAFRIVTGPVSVAETAKPAPTPAVAPRWRIPAIAAAVLVVVAVGAVAIWDAYLRPAPPPQVTAPEKAPAPDIRDKPSIAVLPFENLSGDPEQEYFSDGITEDLITDLAKISGLFVVSRKAVFRYKGKDVTLAQVSRELGIQYVLEGSVRKAGGKVRVNAQLIDATTRGHLWADRYDRDLKDIFVVQDEITGKIVAALEVKLTKGEQELVMRKDTEQLEAYDYFLQGRQYFELRTRQANFQARERFETAIELDPTYAAAYAELGRTYFRDWNLQWGDGPQALDRAVELAEAAVGLDDSLPRAHTWLGWFYLWRKQHEQAIAEAKRAIALDPTFADGHTFLAEILNFAGRPEQAIDLAERALRLDTFSPASSLFHLGHAYYLTGRYEEAIAYLDAAVIDNPDFLPAHLVLAVVHNELGGDEKARAEVAESLRISPSASLEGQRERMPFKDQAVLERYLESLRQAGLPEKSTSTSP